MYIYIYIYRHTSLSLYIYIYTHTSLSLSMPSSEAGACLCVGHLLGIHQRGVQSEGVQWMGVVLYNELVYNMIQVTTPCFHCTPPPLRNVESPMKDKRACNNTSLLFQPWNKSPQYVASSLVFHTLFYVNAEMIIRGVIFQHWNKSPQDFASSLVFHRGLACALVCTVDIIFTTFMPRFTRPKIECLPSNLGVARTMISCNIPISHNMIF